MAAQPPPALTHLDITLRPDPTRTVIRPFEPGDPEPFFDKAHPRAQRIANRVLKLDTDGVSAELARMTEALDERHRDTEQLLLRRFDEVHEELIEQCDASREQKLLIGAYFSEEFSYEAAALFNPSMVAHEDQSGLPEGSIRFAMSLRGIGEGHVSSVTFRSGVWNPVGEITLDDPSATSVPPIIEEIEGEEGAFRLVCRGSTDLSESVLFPVAPSQRKGIEDVRLVNFTDDAGEVIHYGTYTAYDGQTARSEMFRATSFNCFEMRPLQGVVADSKGTALFPRKVDGRYMMLGRQDNENIWLMRSDELYRWTEAHKLLAPKYPWEYVQIGNCGSPIEIDEGWLVLTHGVGVVRNYCVGACLLDKDDPSKVLGRMSEPLLRPSPEERDGYVPNVVYSCGGMVHDRTLLLPYGVADNFTAFASCAVDDILKAME